MKLATFGSVEDGIKVDSDPHGRSAEVNEFLFVLGDWLGDGGPI